MIAALRARLNDPRRLEYIACGWVLLMVGALAQINDALTGLGFQP